MATDILIVHRRKESHSCIHINPREDLWPGTGHMPISGLITVVKEMEYLLQRPSVRWGRGGGSQPHWTHVLNRLSQNLYKTYIEYRVTP